MTTRLFGLYARSRRIGPVLGLIVAAAVLRWGMRPWLTGGGTFAVLLELVLATIAATVVAAGLTGPFGLVERSAGSRLPMLRGGQLAATIAVAAAGCAVTTSVAQSLRDLAGFVGIALVMGGVFGAQRCWALCLGYALVCAGEVDLGQHPAWAWPVRPAGDVGSLVAATVLLAAGVTVAVWSPRVKDQTVAGSAA
jgi:hypothetical protein